MKGGLALAPVAQDGGGGEGGELTGHLSPTTEVRQNPLPSGRSCQSEYCDNRPLS